MPSRALAMSFHNAQAAYPPPTQASAVYAFAPPNGDCMPLHHSNTAQTTSTRAIMDMASMLDSLAASFNQELRDKEQDLNQAHALLSNIQAQILDSQRAVGQLKVQCQGLDKACTKLQEMETELSTKMGVAAHATLGTSACRSYSQQFSARTADMGGIFILVFPTIPPPLPRGLRRTTPSHRRQTQFFRLERLRGGKLFFQQHAERTRKYAHLQEYAHDSIHFGWGYSPTTCSDRSAVLHHSSTRAHLGLEMHKLVKHLLPAFPVVSEFLPQRLARHP